MHLDIPISELTSLLLDYLHLMIRLIQKGCYLEHFKQAHIQSEYDKKSIRIKLCFSPLLENRGH